MENKYNNDRQLIIADVPMNCCFRFTETAMYLKKYLKSGKTGVKHKAEVTETALKDWKRAGNTIDAFAEFCLLCQPVSEILMNYKCCVFHAAALRFRNKAILIAGGSGAGKSTHCHLLLERYPEEFSVINGDKPVLECKESEIFVHPSPWNGKEGLHGADPAPLAALFILKRSDRNSVEKCSDQEAAIFSFPMIFQSFEDEKVIRKAGMITEEIVKKSSCFIFNSIDIEESSAILYQSIRETIDHGI